MRTKDESWVRGFDRGNHGNAYECTDWDTWYANACAAIPLTCTPESYREGMLLGFFSSYEMHEIADDILAETVDTLRKEYGEES